MSAGSQSLAVQPGSVQAERVRIVGCAYAHADDIADDVMAKIREELPGYGTDDPGFLADVHDQLARLSRTGLGALLERKRVTPADVTYARQAAARRARSGLPLVDYIAAFRLGQRAIWKSLLAHAGDGEAGREAVLSLAGPLARYTDLISNQATDAYLEFQQYVAAESGRDGQALMDALLDGTLPAGGPHLSVATAHGIGADRTTPLLVVTAVVLEPAETQGETARLVSAAAARVGVNGLRTLSVVRGGEIVAIPALGRDGSAEQLCERLRAMRAELAAEGISLAVGVSTAVTEVAQIPRAYRQAQAALALLPEDGGVLALPQLTPFRYLLLRADDTTRQLVDPRVGAALADDRARGGSLAETIRAFAAADMNLREAADTLRIHLNTAKYRIGRIQELTGRNVRSVNDLVELLVAIELQTGQSGRPGAAVINDA
ncbi:PucR family transcriptional regulator [Nocardia neocaledoniensis]|uniref:CdaR family transcriptional regulator n=1 Tax=Nocardia neocaledoniensis TaxID=236511 RepID=A0A317N5T0_9NOCA|nr:helix-turn-helix domain-containing protein [Nocardia neocaledoniensis]PWV70646.1 CdaR family transcriptional regulator [Nocardia neocaledoniensis]